MATLLINTRVKKGHIAPEIQGQFSEHLGRGIYEGIFVREDSGIPNVRGMRTDVVNALKEIHVPLLRWPGGCFADEYHWMDGIGPRENRKKMINTNWGGVTEDNSFGTHEFFDLCEQLGCRTYVNGNLGSGTVQEMHDWVEYITFDGVSPMADLRRRNGREKPWKLDWFAVGNESWGCGGNMRPSYYGDLYRQYQSFLRQYNPDSPFKKLAVGANVDDAEWTRTVLATCFDHAPRQFHGFMDGLSLHYYTIIGDDWTVKGGALNFDEAMWYKTMQSTLHMEDLLRMHGAIMDQYDPEKKIAMCVDEWGAWYDVEPGTNPGFLYQQNTMRDALIAGINLNIFNKHCDRVGMACIAQTINVLQSMLLTEGGQCVKTPTYWVFDLYKDHQDAELLDSCLSDVPELSVDTASLSGKIDDGTGAAARSSVEDGFLKAECFALPAVQESVSEKNGVVTITLTNLDLENACPIDIVLSDCDRRDRSRHHDRAQHLRGAGLRDKAGVPGYPEDSHRTLPPAPCLQRAEDHGTVMQQDRNRKQVLRKFIRNMKGARHCRAPYHIPPMYSSVVVMSDRNQLLKYPVSHYIRSFSATESGIAYKVS